MARADSWNFEDVSQEVDTLELAPPLGKPEPEIKDSANHYAMFKRFFGGRDHDAEHDRVRGKSRAEVQLDLFSQLQGVSLTGNGDSFVSDGGVNTTPIPRTRRTSAHVIFLAWFKTCVIKSAGHICVSHKQSSGHLARHVSCAVVVVPALLDLFRTLHTRFKSYTSWFLSRGDDHCDDPPNVAANAYNNSTNSTDSTGPLQISSSDEICHCDDPINVSFDCLAEPHSPTGYEP